MSYHCKCCDYTTDRSDHFTKHLNSKKHIAMEKKSGDYVMSMLQKMAERIDEIDKRNIKLEEQNIKLNERCDILSKICETLKKENKELCKTTENNGIKSTIMNTNSNNNNVYNISINIDRNTFENENLNALDGQVKRLIKNKDGAIAEIVKRLHFNVKHPENRNIRAEGVKSGMIGIHEATESGKEWIKKNKKQALEDIAINATQQFKDKAEEEELSTVMEDTLKKMTEPIIDPAHFDHKRKLRTECKNIEAVLLTERTSGRNPEK